MGEYDHSTHLQQLLDRLPGDPAALRAAVIDRALDRVRRLTAKMFRRHADLRASDETDDVVQLALVRLHKALAEVHPATVRGLFAVAAQQVRWVLLDLARRHAKAKVVRFADDVPGPDSNLDGPAALSGEPSDLAEWAEFHGRVAALPDEYRELFDLLLYQGLPQDQAAGLLGTSVRTVKRRWQHARLALQRSLHGHYPGAGDL